MGGSTYEQLNARAEELQSARYNYEHTMQKIADNLFGRRDFTTERTPGQDRRQRIYDDTANQSLDNLSGAIHSLLVSPAARWFGLRFENADLDEIDGAAQWLKMVEKRLYAVFSGPSANFHAQLAETFTDLIGFGTGGIFVDDVPGVGVRFSNRPIQELYLCEDPSGNIDVVVRKFKLTARQAIALWGDKAEAANRAIKGRGGGYEDKHEYVHLIMPNDEMVPDSLDASGMAWASVFLSRQDRKVMSEGGYHEMPLSTPRWTKEPGEVYGRGCGHNALSNHQMLNEMNKVTITSGQLAIAPPRMVDTESVLPGDLSFAPNAVIPINSVMAGMNPPIQELSTRSRFDVSQSLIADTREVVQNAFHHPLIQTLRDPRMTATQVLELSAQMQRHLAPILGRLQTELLEPIIERVFAIESRAGRLPPAPPEIQDSEIKIEYVSPVAKAQQTSDARAIIDFSGIVANLANVDPDVLDVVDFETGSRELAEALGVPPSMMRSAGDVERRREAKRELASQQAAQEQAVTATDQVAKLMKAAPAPAPAGGGGGGGGAS